MRQPRALAEPHRDADAAESRRRTRSHRGGRSSRRAEIEADVVADVRRPSGEAVQPHSGEPELIDRARRRTRSPRRRILDVRHESQLVVQVRPALHVAAEVADAAARVRGPRGSHERDRDAVFIGRRTPAGRGRAAGSAPAATGRCRTRGPITWTSTPSLRPILRPSTGVSSCRPVPSLVTPRADPAAPVLADRRRRQARVQVAPAQHRVAERVGVRPRIEHVVVLDVARSRRRASRSRHAAARSASSPRHTLLTDGFDVRLWCGTDRPRVQPPPTS